MVKGDFTLNKIKNKLTKSDDYTVLFYKNWLQKINHSIDFNKKLIINKKTASNSYPRLFGTVTLNKKDHRFYTHLNFFYKWPTHTHLITENNSKIQLDNSRLNHKIIHSILKTKAQYAFIAINQEAAIIPEKINYIDHPLIGFIIKIKRFNFIEKKNY